MENLFEKLQKLLESNELWNYYSVSNLIDPFKSPEYDNSKDFIKKFLEYSNKTKDIYDTLEVIEPDRNLHIVVNYFLGILIYEENFKVKKAIDNQLKKIVPSRNNSFDNSFKYFWFLICFYHDVGYYYEKNRGLIGGIEKLKKELKIDHNICDLLGVPKLYHDLKRKYLLYRLEQHGCFDHGILGGMLFYDRMIKIYEYFKCSYGCGRSSFIHKNLYWSDSMVKYFRLMASVILTHNIWFKNKSIDSSSDINLYRRYKLERLVIANSEPKINLNRHPFLFLLSLVDTIEPTKRYGFDFLKKVRFEIPEDDSKILLRNYLDDKEVMEWLKSIFTLKNWIKIEIIQSSNFDLDMVL